MKFTKDITPKGFLLPSTAMRLAGFDAGERAEYHIQDGAVIVLKARMTAMELITAARALHELSVELDTHLATVCGQCDGCGEDSCPLVDLDGEDISLPDYLRENAGIPKDAKLCAYVDEDENTVTIAAADREHDLRDLPPETLEMFIAANVCLGELEERLIVGDIVYGD